MTGRVAFNAARLAGLLGAPGLMAARAIAAGLPAGDPRTSERVVEVASWFGCAHPRMAAALVLAEVAAVRRSQAPDQRAPS